MLRLRASVLAAIRKFFDEHGYWEVETPILSHDIVVDAFLDPFSTTCENTSTECRDSTDVLYLQTSPEAAMKRILAAGAESIYQIARVFRRGESGQFHNPEFTMIEWYQVGDTHHDQMRFTEQLVRHVFRFVAETESHESHTPTSLPKSQFERQTYDDLFKRIAGTPVLHLQTHELRQIAVDKNLSIPTGLREGDRDSWLNLLLAGLAEPFLCECEPTFVYDYPASQAALARIRNDDIAVAERFELFIHGIEICNGYHELTNADELRHRTRNQNLIREREGCPALPGCPLLLAAMDAGLPASSGVALGFDRLLMAVLHAKSIQDVIAFPADRA